jgi:predicted DNA-binding protein with PD1-like motif
MHLAFSDRNTLCLRLDRGEELMGTLKQYCTEMNIRAARFSGIGAAARIMLSWYDLSSKQYQDRVVEGIFEIVSLAGNVSTMKESSVVHAHGSFAGSDFIVFGGHIKELVVGATCELFFTAFDGKIDRSFNEDVGLHVIT